MEIHLDQEEYRCFSLQEAFHCEKENSKQTDSDTEFSSTCPTSSFSTEELILCDEDDAADSFHSENFYRQPIYHDLSNSAPCVCSNTAGPGRTSKSLIVRNKRQDFFDRLLCSTSDFDETIEDGGIFSDRREDFLLSPIKIFLKLSTKNINVSSERREVCIDNCIAEETKAVAFEDDVQHENEEGEQTREIDSAATEEDDEEEEKEEEEEAGQYVPDNFDCLQSWSEGLHTPLGIETDTIDFSLDAITTREFGIWSPDMQRRRSTSSSLSTMKNSVEPSVGRGGGRVRHRLQRNIHSHSPSTSSPSVFPSPCSTFQSPPCFRRRSDGEAIRGPGSACKSLIVEESERQMALSDILLAPVELMLTLPGEKSMKSDSSSSMTQSSASWRRY